MQKNFQLRIAFVIAMTVGIGSIQSFAQYSGTIQGTISDPSGAVLAKAARHVFSQEFWFEVALCREGQSPISCGGDERSQSRQFQ
jgi:beta-lactam-binding protein with PASTA domain